MKPIYFRDFLDKFVAEGGDISKVSFESPRLAYRYNIYKMETSKLIVDRINPRVNPEVVIKRSWFDWYNGWGDSSSIYHYFSVEKISPHKFGMASLRSNRILVTLRREG